MMLHAMPWNTCRVSVYGLCAYFAYQHVFEGPQFGLGSRNTEGIYWQLPRDTNGLQGTCSGGV